MQLSQGTLEPHRPCPLPARSMHVQCVVLSALASLMTR